MKELKPNLNFPKTIPTQLQFFLYLVRSPDYSFFPTFDTQPCVNHLKFNFCTAFFAIYV